MTLNNHHRETVRKILDHPASGNIEWRQVLSLLEAIGEAVEEHNGNFKVTVGSEAEVLHAPRGKDIDEQMVIDLRRLLVQAGYDDSPAVKDGRARNHGDSRWGEPE
jgi:hypothetical protein